MSTTSSEHSKDNNASATEDGTGKVISVAGLTKYFGDRRVLDNLDFSIEKGESVGFLGPNGAGKTTCINILLGLVRKSAGEISILEMPIPQNHREVKFRIGVVPQSDNLDPDLTVSENLLIYSNYYNVPKRLAADKIKELLNFFALSSRKNEIIDHLSGGQRRRLLLARALIHEPELLVLDEPTIGLDPQARQLMWDRLEVLQEQGTTMLITSHYLDEISRLCRRVLILDHGQLMVQGEPRQLIRDLVGIEVFEVEGSDRELDELEKSFEECNATIERVSDKIFVYTREDCSRFEKMLEGSVNWLRRPANLEDLFIQLTGRSLRES